MARVFRKHWQAALLSLWRPLRMVFWLGWVLSLSLVIMGFYLAFFWHPFG